MTGREYFDEWGRRLCLTGLDPDVIQHAADRTEVQHGPAESKLGGRITRDLKQLPPEDSAQRKELSEAFLKQPVEHVRDEEEGAGPNDLS